jgi:hypothetical protein
MTRPFELSGDLVTKCPADPRVGAACAQVFEAQYRNAVHELRFVAACKEKCET